MNPYVAILLLFLFGALFVTAFIVLSALIGKGKKTAGKHRPYESGIDTEGASKGRFPIKFYVIAMLFILFDIEVVFLYPWATLFKEFVAKGDGAFMLIEMMIFLGILAIGLIYIYGRKALEWE